MCIIEKWLKIQKDFFGIAKMHTNALKEKVMSNIYDQTLKSISVWGKWVNKI